MHYCIVLALSYCVIWAFPTPFKMIFITERERVWLLCLHYCRVVVFINMLSSACVIPGDFLCHDWCSVWGVMQYVGNILLSSLATQSFVLNIFASWWIPAIDGLFPLDDVLCDRIFTSSRIWSKLLVISYWPTQVHIFIYNWSINNCTDTAATSCNL